MNSDEFTNQELMLKVGDGHELYVQDWGNKDASLTIFRLHGGPGSACSDKYKSIYNPAKQRVIFHDQRGAGKSMPYGSLRANTTSDLVEDVIKIADHLGINKFVVHGTSWGSTLALAFAVAHPERVEQLVIGGVFTGSRDEIDWLNNGMMKTHYPDVWEKYAASVPEKYRNNPSEYHLDRILNGDKEKQKESAYHYSQFDSSVMPFDDTPFTIDFETFDMNIARIEAHYWVNNCFMPERHIFDNADKLTMPVHIVQGRYDMVCPPQVAYELYKKLPDARIYWTLANHASSHEGSNIFRAIFDGMAL